MRVEIVHPELWNGGGDRLILLAAVALAEDGHSVRITTTNIDDFWIQQPLSKKIELRLLDTNKLYNGDIQGRCMVIAFWELVDHFKRVLRSWYNREKLDPPYDLVISPNTPSILPFYHLLHGNRIKKIYYCYFPAQKMCEHFAKISGSWLARSYARYMEQLEGFCASFADQTVTISLFSREAIQDCMPHLPKFRISLFYPPGDYSLIAGSKISKIQKLEAKKAVSILLNTSDANSDKNQRIIFTVNRFSEEKNLELLIEGTGCYLRFRKKDPTLPELSVILAGSVTGLGEMNNYLKKLQNLTGKLGLKDNITYLFRPNDATKDALFEQCDAVVYTPPREHFGIVPIEALLHSKPCIGCNSGGPKETILDNITGYKLKHNDAQSLADSMRKLFVAPTNLLNPNNTVMHRTHVEKFSYPTFFTSILEIVQSVVE